MSEILTKYNIKFTYTGNNLGVVGVTSDIDLLARIIESFNTYRGAGYIYHSIKSFLDFGKTEEIKLPEIGMKKKNYWSLNSKQLFLMMKQTC